MRGDNVTLTADAGVRPTNWDFIHDENTVSVIGLVAVLAGIFVSRTQGALLDDVRKTLLIAAWFCRQEILGVCVNFSHAIGMNGAYALGTSFVFLLVKHFTDTAPRISEQASKPSLPPLLLPCHTTHTRFFPAKHSFTYSYLLVGIPVGWRYDSGILSCDPHSKPSGWFSVHNEDYLARGSHDNGLRGKLDDYLRQNDYDPAQVLHAYLVTAPRFLGWGFNPVSFWYLYDQHKALRAMILEVNNTFDERRMYLLQPEPKEGEVIFKESWSKDFHVSPFNDRKGEYSIVARDPFETLTKMSVKETSQVKIDNNITLSTPAPDSKPKLVARIYSTSPAVDPAKLSLLQLFKFMIQWCWIGFLTNPRILWEARILWAKKKLQVFYRPEVNVGSIGRQEQKDETVIEGFFCRWLEVLARDHDFVIRYTSAAGPQRGKMAILGGMDGGRVAQDAQADISIDILTPEWYAELARSQNLTDTIKTRCSGAGEGEQMLSISGEKGNEFLRLLDETQAGQPNEEFMKYHGFAASLALRLSQGTPLFTIISQTLISILHRGTSMHGNSTKTFRASITPMLFTEGEDKQAFEEMGRYDNAVLMILLADRIALGYTSLLRGYRHMLRYWLMIELAGYLSAFVASR